MDLTTSRHIYGVLIVYHLMSIVSSLALHMSPWTVRYDGFHVIEVGNITSQDDVIILRELIEEPNRQVILLSDSLCCNCNVTLLISPQFLGDVINSLHASLMTSHIISTNYQRSLDVNYRLNVAAQLKLSLSTFDHTAYLPYDQQEIWLNTKSLDTGHTLQDITQTVEQRSLWMFVINELSTELPVVWIDANIGAREWLTSATALYLIDTILTGTSSDAEYLRNNFRFYFVPNANPDGYVYTFTQDPLWVKTRSVYENNCTGVHLNRNFEVGYGGAGSSSNCMADNYRGPYNWSEVESTAIRNQLLSLGSDVMLYISLRSYQQTWLFPWAYNVSRSDDYYELRRVSDKVVQAINATNNLNFICGTRYDLSESPVSGTSFDWAKQQANIAHSYQVFLRPKTFNDGGFQPEPSNIQQSGQEMFNGLVVAVREIKRKH